MSNMNLNFKSTKANGEAFKKVDLNSIHKSYRESLHANK